MLKRFWETITTYFAAVDGLDDPMGEYLVSLEKRIAALERKNAAHEVTKDQAATNAVCNTSD